MGTEQTKVFTLGVYMWKCMYIDSAVHHNVVQFVEEDLTLCQEHLDGFADKHVWCVASGRFHRN